MWPLEEIERRLSIANITESGRVNNHSLQKIEYLRMRSILVIDDDIAISEIVAVNLEMAGYDVSQA